MRDTRETITTALPMPDLCFRCGYAFELASGAGIPKPNDLTICANCGELLAFLENGKTRPTTCKDTNELSEAQIFTITRTQEHIRNRVRPLPSTQKEPT